MSAAIASIRPRFYMEPVQNPAKTAAEGRPIFDEVEMIEITIPGDRLTRFVALAHELESSKSIPPKTYAQAFPDEYAAFKRGEQRAATGTPIEHWAILTAARVAELKALGILSIDEVAALSDAAARNIGHDGLSLRDQASAHIANARDGALVTEQARQIAELQAQLKTVMAALQSGSVPQAAANEPQGKRIEDATDAELKAYIKAHSGEAPRGNVSRETLVARATEIAASLAGENDSLAA